MSNVCTETLRTKMEALWDALNIPLEGCADVHLTESDIVVTQQDETGLSRFEIVRTDDDYHVYQMIIGNDGSSSCRELNPLSRDAIQNALELYAEVHWETVFPTRRVCFYLSDDETICQTVR